MINRRPETYREVAVLQKAYKTVEYIDLPGVDLVEQICDFLLKNPTNRVVATPTNLMFMNGANEMIQMLHINAIGRPFDLIEMTCDKFNIRTPYNSSSGDHTGSSNNNNNNNNNNNS